jgi:hypothetical protein
MRNIIISINLCFILYSCSNGQDIKTMYIYIPMNYTGWVNIVFGDTSATNEALTFKDGYVYFITKDPESFHVKGDIHSDGRYKTIYCYYNTDTTIRLSSNDYPKNNILYPRILGSRDYKRVHPYSLLAYSFYVNKEALDDSKVTIDMLPKNKILQ